MGRARQADLECHLSLVIECGYSPADSLEDADANAKAQARALANWLGRKEGIIYFGHDVFRDVRAAIGYLTTTSSPSARATTSISPNFPPLALRWSRRHCSGCLSRPGKCQPYNVPLAGLVRQLALSPQPSLSDSGGWPGCCLCCRQCSLPTIRPARNGCTVQGAYDPCNLCAKIVETSRVVSAHRRVPELSGSVPGTSTPPVLVPPPICSEAGGDDRSRPPWIFKACICNFPLNLTAQRPA